MYYIALLFGKLQHQYECHKVENLFFHWVSDLLYFAK